MKEVKPKKKNLIEKAKEEKKKDEEEKIEPKRKFNRRIKSN